MFKNVYNGAIAEIQATLNKQKPSIEEFIELFKKTFLANDENMLTALLVYKQNYKLKPAQLNTISYLI